MPVRTRSPLGWPGWMAGVDECVSFARRAGYERMKLWTSHPLAAARKIYLARGFKLVAEEAHQSFGARLIGQVYELDLRPLLA
jgi:hypothetical protein